MRSEIFLAAFAAFAPTVLAVTSLAACNAKTGSSEAMGCNECTYYSDITKTCCNQVIKKYNGKKDPQAGDELSAEFVPGEGAGDWDTCFMTYLYGPQTDPLTYLKEEFDSCTAANGKGTCQD